MWVEIAGFDQTNLVDPDTINLKSATNDPLASLSFDYLDVGSANPLTIGMPVTVWDETGSSATIAQPSRDLLLNDLMFSSGSGTPPSLWTLDNQLTASVLSYAVDAGAYGIKAVFANNTNAGSNYSQIYQDCGNTFFQKVYPGQTYYAYTTIYATGTISNIQAFIAIQFTDGTHATLGSQTTANFTPVSGGTQVISVSKVAPAGAVYARVLLGAKTSVSGTNSGTIWYGPAIKPGGSATYFTGVCCEPALFAGRNMADGTAVSYPSPDNSTLRTDCVFMADQTDVRMRFLFNGYIKTLKVDYDGTNRHYQVDCLPLGDVIDNGALVTGSFESTTDQSIINSLVSTYLSSTILTGAPNIWTPNTTVQFGQNISSVQFVDETLRDVLNTLSDATGFIYYVDEYNYLWYNDVPFNYATITVNVENADHVTAFPPENYLVEYDASQLTNSVKILGGQFYTIETDVFSGTGSTTSFPLASKPQKIDKVVVGATVDATTYAPTDVHKVGIKGQDTLGSGNIQILFDQNSSTVQFNTAPASGSNNVWIVYPTYRNVAVLVEDNQSIAQYGRKFTSKVTDSNITDSTTAQTRGLSEVGKYSQPITVLTFELTSSGNSTSVYIPRGMTVLVSSALDGFSKQPFTVQQVEVKSKGAGVNVYSYTCGIYRPSMTDAMRHTATALQADTANGSTTPQFTYELLQEMTFYTDTLTPTAGGTAPYVYDTALFGYSAFS